MIDSVTTYVSDDGDAVLVTWAGDDGYGDGPCIPSKPARKTGKGARQLTSL